MPLAARKRSVAQSGRGFARRRRRTTARRRGATDRLRRRRGNEVAELRLDDSRGDRDRSRRGSERRSGSDRRNSAYCGAGACLDRRRSAARLDGRLGDRRGHGGDCTPSVRFGARASRVGWPGSAATGGTPIKAATWSEARGRLGERHPLLDAGIELVGGHVLRGDRPGRGPVAGEGIGQREILADAGIGADRAGGGLEDGDRLGGSTGERQRQAVVGGIEHIAGCLEQGDGLVVLALGDLDQRQLQDDLRLVGDRTSSESR